MAQVNNSWQHITLNGVDENAKATSPAYATDSKTGGKAFALWFKLNTLLTSQGAKFFLTIGSEGGTPGLGPQFAFGTRYRNETPGEKLDILMRPTDGTNSGNEGYRGSTSLTTGVWYFAIFQTDGSTTSMYVGDAGTLTTESVVMWTGSNNGAWFDDGNYIGTRVAVIGSGYNGGIAVGAWSDATIDHIMIFNDDLTADERTAIYNGGKPISPFAVGLGSKVREFIPIGDTDSSSSTINSAVLGTNFTTSNIDASNITSSDYY